jgi:hypothetical protein
MIKSSLDKIMDYWAEYLGVSDKQNKHTTNIFPSGFETKKIFKPYTITTKTINYHSQPKRRDPSRRWK